MAPDPSLIDKKILERGYWIATHRLALKKWLQISLYVLVAFVYVVFFVQFGIYMFRFSEWEDLMAEARRPLADWEQIHSERAPVDIELGAPVVIPIGDSRYDFAVEVYNPNTQFAVSSVTYRFRYGDGLATPDATAFILPGERKYLTSLAFRSAEPIANVIDVESEAFLWKKISRLPPLSWNYTELPKFRPSETIVEGGVQRVIPARVTWTVQNSSTLNLRTVVWQVVLLSGNRLVGIMSHRAENMAFLENRSFELVVSNVAGRVDSVKVYPIVNIFDPGFTYLR